MVILNEQMGNQSKSSHQVTVYNKSYDSIYLTRIYVEVWDKIDFAQMYASLAICVRCLLTKSISSWFYGKSYVFTYLVGRQIKWQYRERHI